MAVLYFRNVVSRSFLLTCRIISSKSIKNKHTNIGQITNVKFEFLQESQYLKPFRMTYKENGVQKYWDIMEMHSAVLILVFNISRKVLIYVKQFRAGKYYVNIPAELRNRPIDMKKYPAELGISLELCAGIVDKAKPLVQVAKEEVLEECGYDVPLKNFELFHRYTANVAITGSLSNMYYCEVTDGMKVSAGNVSLTSRKIHEMGGGIDNEMIDVVELTVEEFEKHLAKPVPSSVLIAYYWFLRHKYQK